MNKYKQAILDIASYDVPPADNSCCYRMQGAVYDIKDIAEAALKKKNGFRRFWDLIKKILSDE